MKYSMERHSRKSSKAYKIALLSLIWNIVLTIIILLQ
jgi:hypothetical protein